jgi:hypothetical protein
MKIWMPLYRKRKNRRTKFPVKNSADSSHFWHYWNKNERSAEFSTGNLARQFFKESGQSLSSSSHLSFSVQILTDCSCFIWHFIFVLQKWMNSNTLQERKNPIKFNSSNILKLSVKNCGYRPKSLVIKIIKIVIFFLNPLPSHRKILHFFFQVIFLLHV